MTAQFTSQEFNRSPGQVKKAAEAGPVFVTERGKRKLVVLNWEEYARLAAGGPSIVELFHDPETADIAFEPGRFGGFMKDAAETR
jgi:prevent-host-death family protein